MKPYYLLEPGDHLAHGDTLWCENIENWLRLNYVEVSNRQTCKDGEVILRCAEESAAEWPNPDAMVIHGQSFGVRLECLRKAINETSSP